MFERIVNSLVHPSRIALCFKDKVWQPISLVLGFFMLLLFVEGMIAINSTYFDRTLCNQVMSVVANIEDESNLIYKDNKLTGDPIKSENSDISIGFLVDDLKYNNGLMFNFFEDRVDVFYQRESIGSYSFSKFDGEFSIKNIQDGVVKDKVIFSDLIYSSLEYLNNILNVNLSEMPNSKAEFFSKTVIEEERNQDSVKRILASHADQFLDSNNPLVEEIAIFLNLKK